MIYLYEAAVRDKWSDFWNLEHSRIIVQRKHLPIPEMWTLLLIACCKFFFFLLFNMYLLRRMILVFKKKHVINFLPDVEFLVLWRVLWTHYIDLGFVVVFTWCIQVLSPVTICTKKSKFFSKVIKGNGWNSLFMIRFFFFKICWDGDGF